MDETLKAYNDAIEALIKKRDALYKKPFSPKQQSEIDGYETRIQQAKKDRDTHLTDPERIERERYLKIQGIRGRLEVEHDPGAREQVESQFFRTVEDNISEKQETERERLIRETSDQLNDIFSRH